MALDVLGVMANTNEVTTDGIRDIATAKVAYPKPFELLGRLTGESYNFRLEDGAKPFTLSCPRDNVAIPLMPTVWLG